MSEKADNCHGPLSVSVSPPQPLCHILVLSCFPALCGYVCVCIWVCWFFAVVAISGYFSPFGSTHLLAITHLPVITLSRATT